MNIYMPGNEAFCNVSLQEAFFVLQKGEYVCLSSRVS